MSVVDKNMYDNLKKWWDRNRPQNQYMMYINSQDRKLTNATIKKLMYDIYEEDVHGEIYMPLYSADNFFNNMREFYSEIGELYYNHPGPEDPILDIIEEYPPTCGWILLIVEDIERLSGKPEKMQEVIETLFRFASKRASVVLVGKGDYKDVFAGCEYALNKMEAGLNAGEEDNIVMLGCFNQEANPDKENHVFENPNKQRDELDFYWACCLYEQLKKKCFDYEDFKVLIRDTMEYIVPRISKEKVYRKDLLLIEYIGALRHEKNKKPEGCRPWEYDAAVKMACGLHKAIINRYNYSYNKDMSEGLVNVDIVIEERKEDYGAIHISGSFSHVIKVKADTVEGVMDKLAETIHEVTYNGNTRKMLNMIHDIDAEDDGSGKASKDLDSVYSAMSSVRDGIKEVADKIVNKEPGRKVRRCKEIIRDENT